MIGQYDLLQWSRCLFGHGTFAHLTPSPSSSLRNAACVLTPCDGRFTARDRHGAKAQSVVPTHNQIVAHRADPNAKGCVSHMTQVTIAAEQQADIIATAHAAADAAREITLKYFRGMSLDTQSKLDRGFDPVTVADRGAELAMRDIIGKMRPDDAIHGEEFPVKSGTSGLTWVLDPIDGTRGFISGTPTWGVLIACRDETQVHLGIIDQPYIGERFFGGFGSATLTGPHGTKPLVTRGGVALADAIIFTTFPEVGTAQDRKGFETVAQACKLTRYGMDCYAYALLAAGQIDLVIEAGLQPYDILGPIGVIEAAGGVVTDWQGNSAQKGGRIVAAGSKALLTEALTMLNGA